MGVSRLVGARRWLLPGLVYGLGQLLTLTVVNVVGAANGRSLANLLQVWDGQQFIALATHGYDTSVDSNAIGSVAFFPGLPALMSGLAHVTGLSLATAGVAISMLSGLVFAYGLVALVRRLMPNSGDRTGLVTVALVSVAPLSVVLSMVYTEALFCAVAVWTLVVLLDGHWIRAGLLCLAAGFVRSTAAALVVAILVAALVALYQHRSTWRTWVGLLLAPLGLLGYLGWAAHHTGYLDGWFRAQRLGWNTQFDYGVATWRFIRLTIEYGSQVQELVTVLAIGGALILFLVLIRDRLPAAVIAYTAAVLVLDLGSDGLLNSKLRLLLPAFTLLVPLALRLARQRTATLLFALAVVAITGTWYSAYALSIYRYAL